MNEQHPNQTRTSWMSIMLMAAGVLIVVAALIYVFLGLRPV
jgi:hypothetical protein